MTSVLVADHWIHQLTATTPLKTIQMCKERKITSQNVGYLRFNLFNKSNPLAPFKTIQMCEKKKDSILKVHGS